MPNGRNHEDDKGEDAEIVGEVFTLLEVFGKGSPRNRKNGERRRGDGGKAAQR
jgi:hypothetical protein